MSIKGSEAAIIDGVAVLGIALQGTLHKVRESRVEAFVATVYPSCDSRPLVSLGCDPSSNGVVALCHFLPFISQASLRTP